MADEVVVQLEGSESTPPTPVIIEVPAAAIDPAQAEMIRVTAECVAELRSLRDEVQSIRGEMMGVRSDIQTTEALHGRVAELGDRLALIELEEEEEEEEIEPLEPILTNEAPASVEEALLVEGVIPPNEPEKIEHHKKRSFVSL